VAQRSSQASQAEGERTQAQAKVAALEEIKAALEASVRLARDEADKLRQENQSLAKEVDSLQASFASVTSELREKEAEMGSLRTSSTDVRARLNEREGRIRDLEATLGKLQHEAQERGEGVERARRERAEVTAWLALLTGEVASLFGECCPGEDRPAEAMDCVRAIKTSVSALRSACSQLQLEVERSRSPPRDADKEAKLRRQVAGLLSEKSRLEGELKAVRGATHRRGACAGGGGGKARGRKGAEPGFEDRQGEAPAGRGSALSCHP
jgi:chromosome segregation protein